MVVVGPDVVELLSITVKIDRPSGETATSLKRFILRNRVVVSLVFPFGADPVPAAFKFKRIIVLKILPVHIAKLINDFSSGDFPCFLIFNFQRQDDEGNF